MSRKPIFIPEQQTRNAQTFQTQFQTGRQADTRVNAMKKTEALLSHAHNAPFSGFSTATQSQDMNSSFISNKPDEGNAIFQQILKHVNQMFVEKAQIQDTKLKELQTQVDSNRSLIFDLRTQIPQSNEQLNKTIQQFDESLKAKIQKAQEELVKQQGNFQNDYNQKFKEFCDAADLKLKNFQNQNYQNLVKIKEELIQKAPQQNLNDDKIIKDMQLKIKDLQLLFDSLNNEIKINDQKLKQQFIKMEKTQNEQMQRIQVQEDTTIAQFKQIQISQQNSINQANKKVLDEIDLKFQQVQLQINTKTQNQVGTQNEITIQQAELNKMTQGVLELQNQQKLQSQLYSELSFKLDQYISQYSKQEQVYKQLIQKVDQNKDENDNGIIQVKLELSSLSKQFERLSLDSKNQYEYLQDQSHKQSEEIRKSYQEVLFSFKQSEQNHWMDEYNQKKAEIAQAQVQVFSYEEDSESKSDQQINDLSEQNNNENNDCEFERDQFMDKLKSLSPQKKGEVIEEKTIELKNEINKDEEEENDEVTYQLDDQGYLLDEEGNYILDDDGQMIQLNETQIEYLRKQEMVLEEDN